MKCIKTTGRNVEVRNIYFTNNRVIIVLWCKSSVYVIIPLFLHRETMIIFVYDLTKKVENDDPTGSIIYFHPMWVSELQKKSLCGQLMV